MVDNFTSAISQTIRRVKEENENLRNTAPAAVQRAERNNAANAVRSVASGIISGPIRTPELDKSVGNDQPTTFDAIEQDPDIFDRGWNVLTGAVRNFGSGMANVLATGFEGAARNIDNQYEMADPNAFIIPGLHGGLEDAGEKDYTNEDLHQSIKPLYDYADRLGENAARDIEEAKAGLGKLGRAGVDIAENLLQMGMDAAVGVVTGGGGLPSMFLRSAGSSARDARLQGADFGQQVAYGTVKGGIEVLTEKLADGLAGIYGKGAADEFTEKVISRLAKTDTGRSLLRLISGATGEGVEEFVSNLLSPFADAIYKTDEAGNRKGVGQLYSELVSPEGREEMLYDFLIGAAVGLLGGTGNIVTGGDARANAELRAQEAAVQPTAQTETQAPAPVQEQTAPAQIPAQVQQAEPLTPIAQAVLGQQEQGKNTTTDTELRSDAAVEAEKRNAEPGGNHRITEEDVDRWLNTGKTGHIKHAKERGGSNLVLTSDTEIKNFIRDSINGDVGEDRQSRVYGVVGSSLAGEINQLSDGAENVNDWFLEIPPNDVKHSYDDHANAKEPGNINLTLQDYENIANYIDTYDDVFYTDFGNGNREVVIGREIDGYSVIIELISNKRNALLFKNMWGLTTQEYEARYKKNPASTRGRSSVSANALNTSPVQSSSATTLSQPAPAVNTPIQPVQPNAEPGTEGTKKSQTAETVRTAGVTTEEVRTEINAEMKKGGFRYIPISNDAATQEATQIINARGWDAALSYWSGEVARGVTGNNMAAMGALLYNHAVETGNTQLALDVLETYSVFGRNTARGLQAMKILKNLTPQNQLLLIQRGLSKLSQKYGDRVPGGLKISDELKTAYMEAESDAERSNIVQQMQQEVAEQIPANLKDKLTALRYLNMLGNFRTQARNILGNTSMALLYNAKNAGQNLLERIAKAVNPDYEMRTSLTADKALVQEARADYEANAEAINGEQKYSDNMGQGFEKGVEEQRTIFGSRIMEGYRNLTNWAMTAGDTVFIGARYARTLAGYLQANGMDAETFAGIRNGTITPTEAQQQLIDNARAYAAQEAQEATFHDRNQISDWVSRLGRGENTPKWARAIAEGVLPFRKTPANVAVRAVEFSPVGLVTTAANAAVSARNGTFDTGKFMNSLSKNLTGTGIFALGMLLRSMGMLRGHEDDEKQSMFDELRGMQDYSFVLPDGTSYTLDWLSPTAIPLFMGANMMQAMSDGGLSWEDLGQMWSAMTDPMLEMSMLQGVNDLIESIANAKGSGIMNIGLSAMMSLATQYGTNTLLGQLERGLQGARTTTYKDADTAFGRTLQSNFGKAANKIPGYDYNQVEYVDAWGRTEQNSGLFSQMFSPGYISHDNSTDVDDELQRLYDAGQGNVFPQRISQTEQIGLYDEHGKRTGERRLTADEYVTFQKVMGQTSLELVRDLMQSDVYANMSDEARAKAISNIYAYAKNQAAQAVEPSTAKSYDDVTTLSNVGAFYGAQAAFNAATNNEYNRDYIALDNLMDNYGDLPEDVRELLEKKNSYIGAVYAAREAGIDSEEYYGMKDTLDNLTPAEGYKGVPNWQRVSTIGQSGLSMEDQDFFMRQVFEGGTLEKYDACRAVNYRPQDIAEFYRLYTVTTGTDANGDGRSDNGSKKANIINAAMEYGFSKGQATELYNMFNKGSWTG